MRVQIGFITDKIYRDNNGIGENVISIIRDFLKIEPIIIGSNKYDHLAHADGYMAFLNEKTICLSQYPDIPFLKDDIEYVGKIEEKVNENCLSTVKFYDRPIAKKVAGGGNTEDDKSKDCLNSVRGIYINFLRLNDTIIQPEYTILGYKRMMDYNTVNKHTLIKLGYKVLTINCEHLARLGGGLEMRYIY